MKNLLGYRVTGLIKQVYKNSYNDPDMSSNFMLIGIIASFSLIFSLFYFTNLSEGGVKKCPDYFDILVFNQVIFIIK